MRSSPILKPCPLSNNYVCFIASRAATIAANPARQRIASAHSGELDYFGQHHHAVALDSSAAADQDRMPIWPLDWWRKARDAAMASGERATVMGTSGGHCGAVHGVQNPERTLRDCG
jgi:hypothetical protein